MVDQSPEQRGITELIGNPNDSGRDERLADARVRVGLGVGSFADRFLLSESGEEEFVKEHPANPISLADQEMTW